MAEWEFGPAIRLGSLSSEPHCAALRGWGHSSGAECMHGEGPGLNLKHQKEDKISCLILDSV